MNSTRKMLRNPPILFTKTPPKTPPTPAFTAGGDSVKVAKIPPLCVGRVCVATKFLISHGKDGQPTFTPTNCHRRDRHRFGGGESTPNHRHRHSLSSRAEVGGGKRPPAV